MKTSTIGSSVALAFLMAACGGKFTELGQEGGRGGQAGTAGMAAASAQAGEDTGGSKGSGATGGSADGGTGNTSGTGGSATGGTANASGTGGSAKGGTGNTSGTSGSAGTGGAMCQVDTDCPVSKAACQLCADGSSACPWARCEAGQCTNGIDTCPSTECKVDADCPISKAPCQLCDDGSSACPWAKCDAGTCTAGIDHCPAPADPCAGKSCGDTCTTCTGSEPCLAVIMFCDANLSCTATQPQCGGTMCTTDMDCATDVCVTCPNAPSTSCAPQACVQGQCTANCTSPCGACAAGTTCVYQIGGPADPGGYRCAMQNPCGSALRCACIVGEGTCTDAGTTPDYCQCDNGIR